MINIITLLIKREWLRMIKEPSRMLGMILQPLLFLLLFGAGFKNNFFFQEREDLNYLNFFFPGSLALVVLFSSIYSTLSLVEDRTTGFFSYISLGPKGPIGAALGKLWATFSVAFIQGLLFLLLIFFLPINKANINFILVILALFLGSLVFSLIGNLFAWLCPSASAFHALMSIFLLPMWLLSGALFPLENTVFDVLKSINPMSFFVLILQQNLLAMKINNINWLYLVVCTILFSLLLLFVARKKSIE